MTFAAFAARVYCRLKFNLVFIRTPRAFSVNLLSSWVAPSIYWHMRLFLPRCRTLYFSLLNLTRFLSARFSSLLRSLDGSSTLWHISHCVQFCVISKLVEGALSPITRSIMNMLNRIGPNIEPWDTLLATGLQLNFILLTTILWALPFSQLLIHLTVCLSSPYINS